ncbi:MAG: DUF1963 domain-containing protein [Cyanobacteria bacterium J06621_11]
MEPSEIKTVFEEWNAKHRRDAWHVSIDNSDTKSLSWFGGAPTASNNFEWPTCAQCKKPMQFFLQLDLSSLPNSLETPLRDGLLHLFYCSSDDGMCETWEAFSGTHELRVVQRFDNQCSHPPEITPLPKAIISGWQLFTDSPSPAEHELLGIKYDYDFSKNIVSVEVEKYGINLRDLNIDLNVAETISESSSGDKLGGWPDWVQGPEYPACTECQKPMDLLFQIDSNDNLDYMFGDVGCAHITQCQEHPHVLAFAWACG